MNKKNFKELCSFNVYKGRGKRTNVIFFEWKENDLGRGFKYAVASELENITKAELFNHFYDWIINSINLPYFIRYKYAINDKDRFKTPIALNF